MKPIITIQNKTIQKCWKVSVFFGLLSALKFNLHYFFLLLVIILGSLTTTGNLIYHSPTSRYSWIARGMSTFLLTKREHNLVQETFACLTLWPIILALLVGSLWVGVKNIFNYL